MLGAAPASQTAQTLAVQTSSLFVKDTLRQSSQRLGFKVTKGEGFCCVKQLFQFIIYYYFQNLEQISRRQLVSLIKFKVKQLHSTPQKIVSLRLRLQSSVIYYEFLILGIAYSSVGAALAYHGKPWALHPAARSWLWRGIPATLAVQRVAAGGHEFRVILGHPLMWRLARVRTCLRKEGWR